MAEDQDGGGVVKRGPGHPLEYDRDAIVEVICEGLARGIPLAEICRGPGMPSPRSVHDWKRADPDIAAPILRAREEGYEAIVERARLTLRGRTADQGGESTGDVVRDKAIADYDLKLLAKWCPALYGDRVALTNAAGNGDARLEVISVLADELAGLLGPSASFVDVTPRALTSDAPTPGTPAKG